MEHPPYSSLNNLFSHWVKQHTTSKFPYIAGMENEEPLSDDPEEQLRLENELLKLKLQAEMGAQFGGNADLPPEVEQEFLKQIMAFQEQQKDAPLVVLGDYAGLPTLKPAADLNEPELEVAWVALEALLIEKQLHLTFGSDYPTSVKYEFVRQDLAPLEIMQPTEGHNWIFEYEEFHPNHGVDMKQNAAALLNDFFENNLTEDAPYFTDPLIGANRQMVTVAAVVEKAHRFHDLFAGIKDFSFDVTEVKVDEASEPGALTMGFVEGTITYIIQTEDYQEEVISGPFKCYLHQIDRSWEIFCFHIHGFTWDN